MTAQDLKNSILQLAIQGKLVEQRAEEGTARELLTQIKAEKEQLVKEKKIKKERPLPGISEEEIPFEIPESWEWVRLSDVCTKMVDGDHNPSRGVDICTEYIMASSININNNTIVELEKVRYLTKEVFEKENERTKVAEGDIFFTSVGTLGRSCVYRGGYNICFQRSVSVICTLLFNYYLKYLFDSAYFQYKIKREATGTAQKGFYLNQLAVSLVPVPPLAEQKRIVAKIEELLPYVEKYDKAYYKLEVLNKKFPGDMQKSILQYAMQGKLVEQRPEEGTGEELYQQIQTEKEQLITARKIKKEKPLSKIAADEIPFDIPASWKWVRLGEIISFQGGYAFKSDAYIEKSDNQVVRLGNVKNNKLLIHEKEVFVSDELAEQAGAYKIHENDILVTMTGTRRKKDYFFTVLVGKNDVSERKLYLNQRVGCFRATDGIYHKYLLYALQNDIIKDIIFTKETGTANQGNLSSEDMKQFVYIPLPPYEEQKRIVEELENIMSYCQKLNKKERTKND